MRDYHDTEWGNRVHGEPAYFERLTLEAFQSGLSWSTILDKRARVPRGLRRLRPRRGRGVRRGRRGRLMADAGSCGNRAKIDAAIVNARATVALREAEGLEALLLSFAPEARLRRRRPPRRCPPTSPESKALSSELKRRGFAFVGPTTMYALMEAIGVFDPHLVGCFRRRGPATRGQSA